MQRQVRSTQTLTHAHTHSHTHTQTLTHRQTDRQTDRQRSSLQEEAGLTCPIFFLLRAKTTGRPKSSACLRMLPSRSSSPPSLSICSMLGATTTVLALRSFTALATSLHSRHQRQSGRAHGSTHTHLDRYWPPPCSTGVNISEEGHRVPPTHTQTNMGHLPALLASTSVRKGTELPCRHRQTDIGTD